MRKTMPHANCMNRWDLSRMARNRARCAWASCSMTNITWLCCSSDVSGELFTARAQALDQIIDFAAAETFRQEHGRGQLDFIEAGDVRAFGALEMRVFVRLVAGAGAEAPHLVGTGDAVHQFIFRQPFQH